MTAFITLNSPPAAYHMHPPKPSPVLQNAQSHQSTLLHLIRNTRIFLLIYQIQLAVAHTTE